MRAVCFGFLLMISLESAAQQTFTVYFDLDRSELSPEQVLRVDSFITANGKQAIRITGHTDSRGTTAYNLALSRKRVAAVKNHFIKMGYPGNLFLKETGMGESSLVRPDEGDEAKGAVNRRVEIGWEENEIITVSKPQRSAASVKEVGDLRSIKERIEDTAVKKGRTLLLDNMNFEGGRHRILPTSLPQLRSLLEAMQNNPGLKIALEGHICCLAGDWDGMDFDTQTEDLSFQRAKAIYEYLVYSGIDKKRMQYRGFGHSVPLFPFPEKTAEERTANRRVEIRILDK